MLTSAIDAGGVDQASKPLVLVYTCAWVRQMVALAGGVDNAVAEARRRGYSEAQISSVRRRCL